MAHPSRLQRPIALLPTAASGVLSCGGPVASAAVVLSLLLSLCEAVAADGVLSGCARVLAAGMLPGSETVVG